MTSTGDQTEAHPKDNPIARAAWYLSRARAHSQADLRNIVYLLEAYQHAGGHWASMDHLRDYLSGLGSVQVGIFLRAWRLLQEASVALGGPVMPVAPVRPPGRPRRGAAPPWPVWRPTPTLVEALRAASVLIPLRVLAARRWRHVWQIQRLVKSGRAGAGHSLQLVDTGDGALRFLKLTPEAMAALNTLALEAGGYIVGVSSGPYPNIDRMLEIQPGAALVSPVLWGTIPASAARLGEILGRGKGKGEEG